MKKFKKLIPAFCLLLVSAVLMGTSTFAWFSMNKTVTATGMQVTAKSDNPFLIIAAGDTIDGDSLNRTATSANTADLAPVMPKTTLSSTNVAEPASWQYAYSIDPAASAKSGEYVECTTLTGYVASEKFAFDLSNKSGVNTAANLKLTGITITADKALNVVIVCGTNIYTHKATAANLTEVLAATMTKGTPVVITVYYYIDGEDAKTYSDNAANLGGSVTMNFAID